MTMREYIITVKDPASWDSGLWEELTVDGLGDNFIPQRSLGVLNERPSNDYCAHFNLTDEEAKLIRQDDRILQVELIDELREDIVFSHCSSNSRPVSAYSKSPTQPNNAMKNWALSRCYETTNNFGTGFIVSDIFDYNLDGSNVDIIVIDSGVEQNHPEFAINADGTGGSRVKYFNWATLPSGAALPLAASDLGDYNGHGSNCASIAAGNTCGWASGANIYSIRVQIFPGPYNDITTGLPLTQISTSIVFDLVRDFHTSKPINPVTGYKNPTICTNSWGSSFIGGYTGLTQTVYQGVPRVPSPEPNTAFGQITTIPATHYPPLYYSSSVPARNATTDQNVKNCSDVGVVLVGAAGNSGYLIENYSASQTSNYNNYAIRGFNMYYHQGMSPTAAPEMICVGGIDCGDGLVSTEVKINFSNTGPRIDIFAPGFAIMGAYANSATNNGNAVKDNRNGTYYLNKVNGTSQACPQVTGLLACVLQARPDLGTSDPTQMNAMAKKFLAGYSNSTTGLTQTGPSGYTNFTDLQGAPNRYLYQPFNSPNRGSITS